MARFQPLPAVAAGGAIGALTRWGILNSMPSVSTEGVLWAINIIGSLLLGILIGRRETLGSNLFAALGSGFTGGLTSFSTFAVDVAAGLDSGQPQSVLITGIATPVVAVLAAGIGYRLSRSQVTRRRSKRSISGRRPRDRENRR